MTFAPVQRTPASTREWVGLAIALVSGVSAAILVVLAGPGLAILVMLGLAALLATAYAPGLVLAALLLVPFYKGAIQPFSPIDITVVLAGLNVVQAIPVFLDRRDHHRSGLGLVLWLALGMLLVGGILYASDQNLALSHVLTFWTLLFLPILPAALRVGADHRYVRQFLWAFFGLGVLTVILGVLDLSKTDRLVILGGNTINASRAALLVPLVGLTFVIPNRAPILGAITRAGTLLLIPLAIVVALASGSRGPLLALALLGILAAGRYLLIRGSVDSRAIRRTVVVVVASVLILAIAAPQLPGSSLQRFALFQEFLTGTLSGEPTASGDTSSGARVRLFSAAVRMFEQRPLLGAGPAGYQALSAEFLGPVEADQYPHNALLQFAAEFGLVGVTLFVALVVLGLARRLPPDNVSRALRIAFLFFLLNAMISGDIFADRATWGLLVLVLCLDMPRRATPPSELTGVAPPVRLQPASAASFASAER
jgi:O-antigen ligase